MKWNEDVDISLLTLIRLAKCLISCTAKSFTTITIDPTAAASLVRLIKSETQSNNVAIAVKLHRTASTTGGRNTGANGKTEEEFAIELPRQNASRAEQVLPISGRNVAMSTVYIDDIDDRVGLRKLYEHVRILQLHCLVRPMR